MQPTDSLSLRLLALSLMIACASPGVSRCQPALFGSLDDPAETHRTARWDRERTADIMAGVSLIGAQWRTGGRIAGRYEGSAGSILFDGSLRAGVYGHYAPDTDEWYDLARLLRFARIDPVGRRRLYARVGALRRMRLGTGHLVDFFSGETAWDDRALGIETMIGGPSLALFAFADDLRMDRVLGARLAIAPLSGARSQLLRSITLGVAHVRDRATRNLPFDSPVEAWQADLRLEAVRSGAFALYPFVSLARFTEYGQGLLFGADLEADNFIDLARVHFRLAVHYGSDGFIPGYFGAFYQVHNARSAIIAGDEGNTAGIPLFGISASNDVLSELRIHIFERFEFWYAFRRHYGSQRLSTLHLRLFMRTGRFRLALGQDRGGLKGLLSVAEGLGDFTTLTFQSSYRLVGRVWLRADARYTFEAVDPAADGAARFIAQRRFEPYMGLRISW